MAAGPFDSLEEANEKAVALMQRGGAGYVQAQGEQYLVLLCAYDAEESADKVAQRLDGDAGLTMQTLDVSSGTALLNVTASQSRGQRIQESYQTFTQALQALDDAWRQLDAGQTQTTDAVASAGALAAQLEQARAAAFEGTLIEGDARRFPTGTDASRAASPICKQFLAQTNPLWQFRPRSSILILRASRSINRILKGCSPELRRVPST